jgi:hypothetical protein
MKLLALCIATMLTFSTPAQAAQKKIAVKKVEQIATVESAEILVANNSSVVLISNTQRANSDITLNALDATGKTVWEKNLDSGLDEIAMAASRDGAGNLWLAGFSATASTQETLTPTVISENPDGVLIELSQGSRSDLNRLTIWKVSSTGELLATYYSSQNLPGLINGISVTSTGLTIVGQYNQKSFIQSANLTGTFGKVFYIGTEKTTLNSVIRNPDGSSSAFGFSSETLAGKKLAAKQDGILAKVSKNGTLANVVRSSALNAERSWQTSDSSFLLSGYVKVGKKIESAITKFTPTFAPQWTIRVPSTGESSAISAGKISIAAVSSNSSVSSITGWNPIKPSLLLLTLDSKGLITSAAGSTELVAPIGLSYSKELGVVGLARTPSGSVTLFKVGK